MRKISKVYSSWDYLDSFLTCMHCYLLPSPLVVGLEEGSLLATNTWKLVASETCAVGCGYKSCRSYIH